VPASITEEITVPESSTTSLDTIIRVHLSTGQRVDVVPGTFEVTTDPLFPGQPVYRFTAPAPLICGEEIEPETTRTGLLSTLVHVVRNHSEA
jgi:hypothetical protein